MPLERLANGISKNSHTAPSYTKQGEYLRLQAQEDVNSYEF